MAEKNNTHFQNNSVILIVEERNTLYTIDSNEELGVCVVKLNMISRSNSDLSCYLVDCNLHKRCGFTAYELFDMINKRYIESGYKPLDELFTFIKRI